MLVNIIIKNMAKLIKRPAGPKKPPGETRKDIVSILLKLEREKPELNEYRIRDPEFKDGKWIIYPAWQSILQFRIKEPELIEIIRKELDIHDKKVISDHLVKLCKEGELIKSAKNNKGQSIRLSEQEKVQNNTTGNENEWEIDPESFKKLAERLLGTEDELMFLQSNYAKQWIEDNAFNEFITNFGIDLNAIQKIIKLFPNNQRLHYIEILRTKITQISTLSPTALKFILDTKVDNTISRINALAILNESSSAVKLLFDLQIKENMFFEKYGAEMDFNTFQKIINNSPDWTMLNYCEFSIKVMENDVIKDFFRYPDFFLEQTKPFTNALGEHLLETMMKAASSLRSQQKPDIVAEHIIQTVVNEMERKANIS